jgi:hypothetical protein
MSSVWIGVPVANHPRRRLAFDGPVAVFEGAAFTFLREHCEAFRQGLSSYHDAYACRVIDGPVLEEFGRLARFLRQEVADYPEEWQIQGGLVARRENVLPQLEVLAGIVERAQVEARPVECWGK